MIGKILKILAGAIFVIGGVFLIWFWWSDVLALIRGGLGFGLILVGLIFFAILD